MVPPGTKKKLDVKVTNLKKEKQKNFRFHSLILSIWEFHMLLLLVGENSEKVSKGFFNHSRLFGSFRFDFKTKFQKLQRLKALIFPSAIHYFKFNVGKKFICYAIFYFIFIHFP